MDENDNDSVSDAPPQKCWKCLQRRVRVDGGFESRLFGKSPKRGSDSSARGNEKHAVAAVMCQLNLPRVVFSWAFTLKEGLEVRLSLGPGVRSLEALGMELLHGTGRQTF